MKAQKSRAQIKHQGKKSNLTLSIPEALNLRLHSLVEKQQISKFVTQAIEKALDEEKTSLMASYREAEKMMPI